MDAKLLDDKRAAIRALTYASEQHVVSHLLGNVHITEDCRASIDSKAALIIRGARARKSERGSIELFMQTFGLSTDEGIALLSLAEALLRIPDAANADNLIAEKLHAGSWSPYQGQSESALVNLVTRGLTLSSTLTELDEHLSGTERRLIRRLINRLGEPAVRFVTRQAVRIMSDEFVLGHSIEQGLCRAKRRGMTASFDILGEGARTAQDAECHFRSYLHAIQELAATGHDGTPIIHGISVKLSALHPRYEYTHRERVLAELMPRLLHLALRAHNANIQFTIDAEEAARFDLSLDLIEGLARDPRLADWSGLGVALQCYSKRAPAAVDWLAGLARDTHRRLMVRLVKGAYWDAEIKHAQELGLPNYPVFTRKVNTDLCYLACAQKALQHSDALYPQFATHNACTIAAIMEIAGSRRDFEFQRLHGMGELLYSAARDVIPDLPLVRIYAPVGKHCDLLGYLMRRLLENGANTSFVNRLMDESISAEQLVENPLLKAQGPKMSNAKIPLPVDLYGSRRNSSGLDLFDPSAASHISNALQSLEQVTWRAGPIVSGARLRKEDTRVTNPADRSDVVGFFASATHEDIEHAVSAAVAAQPAWNEIGGANRAIVLEHASYALENERSQLISLLVREAGKTLDDAIAELREAVDFCRYYAAQARMHFDHSTPLPGPSGEENLYALHGRGVFVCISPWNFPLAIFLGQVTAALAAGNSVLAKPAEQTPLIAAAAVELLHRAGVPVQALHLLPGAGETIGAALVADERIAGVAMTGSTGTAKFIAQKLAQRNGPIIPLIAETGGQNAMFVDSTALPEQVVDDVIRSAFKSAGQRCSALRVLYVQEEIADKIIKMLRGAMDELTIGNPAELATDIGPVIDQAAAMRLLQHINELESLGCLIHRSPLNNPHDRTGTFIAPHLFEINSIKTLETEHFGPILHIIRYRALELDRHLSELKETGFGLTLGVHSRIEAFAEKIFQHSCAGNVYVNRNMVGAVVGVQPFGGFALSGTGPKAGGPLYLQRFGTERVLTINTAATGGNVALLRAAGDD